MDGPLTNFSTDISEISIISSNEGGNKSGFYGIFQIFPGFTQSRYPSQGTQATLTQDKETKKV